MHIGILIMNGNLMEKKSCCHVQNSRRQINVCVSTVWYDSVFKDLPFNPVTGRTATWTKTKYRCLPLGIDFKFSCEIVPWLERKVFALTVCEDGILDWVLYICYMSNKILCSEAYANLLHFSEIYINVGRNCLYILNFGFQLSLKLK